MEQKHFNIFLVTSLIIIFIWSVIKPTDILTWFLEVFPVIIGAIVLVKYRKYKFTQLLYVLLWFHAIILIVGGHYTYAENPLFEWIKNYFGLERNYYDRLGHFFQGFVPAIVIREIFIREKIVKNKRWLFFIIVSICLAASAVYELVEWWSVLGAGDAAGAFLGAQGDIWDAQKDMLLALIGSIVGLLALAKLHDKYMVKEGFIKNKHLSP